MQTMTTPLAELRTLARTRRRELDRQSAEARALAARGKAVQAEVAELREQVRVCERVAGLLNGIGEARQEQAQRQVEGLVTLGLQSIFGPELSFHLVAREGKTPGVDLVVRTTLPEVDGEPRVVETGVLDARGGGVAATVGFLLRLVILLLGTEPGAPGAGRLLVLDESFSHVSAEYLDRVASFLRQVTDRTGVQILLVTHQFELAEQADAVYRFSLAADGTTRVER